MEVNAKNGEGRVYQTSARIDEDIKSWFVRVGDDQWAMRNAYVWWEYNKVQSCTVPESKTAQRWAERERMVKMKMKQTHRSRKTSL